MRFLIKNTMEDGCLMFHDADKWEVSLRNIRGEMQGVLTFEGRYLTSMSEESYHKIRELFESREILNVGTIIINDWAISFIMKEQKNDPLT